MIEFIKRKISWLYWHWVLQGDTPRCYKKGDLVQVTAYLRIRKPCNSSLLHAASNDYYGMISSKVKLKERYGVIYDQNK